MTRVLLKAVHSFAPGESVANVILALGSFALLGIVVALVIP